MNAEYISVGGKMFGLWDERYAIYQQASPLCYHKGKNLSGVAPETLNPLVSVPHGWRYFYALKGGVCMSELLFFIIGIMLGGCIGIVTMCLFQINRLHRKDDDK